MNKEERKTLTVIQRFIIGLTFFQILLWYNWLEAITYAVAYKNWFTYLVFATLTVSAMLFVVGYWRLVKKTGKIVLICFLCILGFMSLFSTIAWYISNNNEIKAGGAFNERLLEYKDARDKYGESDRKVLYVEGWNLLRINQDATIAVWGAKRSDKKRYLGIGEAIYNSFSSKFRDIEPSDFRAYASLIDPEWEDMLGERYNPLYPYLSWQYPEYVFIIAKLEFDEKFQSYRAYVHETSEDFRFGKRGIGQMQPLLEELVTGKIFNRFRIYLNIGVFTFNSPLYRTDLVNDPYFLVERGDFEGARMGLENLPRERRVFMEEKLRMLGKQ